MSQVVWNRSSSCLDGNPLDDIRNTQRIAAVVANGRYMDLVTRRSTPRPLR